MSDINKIIERIIEDAKNSADEIIKKAEAEASSIKNKALEEAKQESEAALKEGRERASQAAMRIKAAAAMESRKAKLKAKQDIIEECYAAVIHHVKELPDTEYAEILKKMILSCSVTGDEKVLIPECDYKALPSGFLRTLNEDVKTKGLKGSIEVLPMEEDRPPKSGFIMRRGDVDINATLESLLRMHRDELELLVAGILF